MEPIPLSLPILMDGATGTELQKRGMPQGACTCLLYTSPFLSYMANLLLQDDLVSFPFPNGINT